MIAIEPVLLLALIVGAWLYLHGAQRLRASGATTAVPSAASIAFFAGVGIVAVALALPLERASHQRLSVHMVQHLLLVLAAAPLLTVGRPQLVIPSALPTHLQTRLRRLRRRHHRRVQRSTVLMGVTAAHILAVWAWHIPAVYELALRSGPVHMLEHVTFLGTALAIWVVLLSSSRRSRAASGTAVLCIAVLLTSGGVLGALLTFAETPLYAHYAVAAAARGAIALEDQQLAGALMWIPGGVFYGIAAAAVFLRWFRAIESTDDRQSFSRLI